MLAGDAGSEEKGQPVSELSQEFNALVDEVHAVEHKLLAADPALDESDLLDGYRLAFSLLRVAVDAYVWGDKDKPILGRRHQPYLKWGGDNSDAFFQFAPLDSGAPIALRAIAATPCICR